jgi:cobalt/nickel transport system ATP-binding protein
LTETVFRLDRVSFSYPGFGTCLEEVSLHVEKGERVALLGANGSGKSTVLRLMDGLQFASRGEVTALGEVLSPSTVERPPFGPRFRKEVGFLFQDSDAQLFSPNVEDELAFGPLQMGWKREEILTRISGALEIMDIAVLRRRPPQSLSAGEKKKVALASLLVLSPSVLLLDEPTAGLDPRSQGSLLELLEELHDAGLTTVTATHDLELVPHLADRAVVLGEDHRVAADGPVREVLADTDLLVRVNLIHAHRHRHGAKVHSHPHRHTVMHEHPHRHDDH